MKRVLSAFVVMMFVASMAFAADDAAKIAPASAAAAEVTKGAADVATQGIERRGERRAARRGALLGTDKAAKDTKTEAKTEKAEAPAVK